MFKQMLKLTAVFALIGAPMFAFASVSPTVGDTPNEEISESGYTFWQVFPPDHSAMQFYARDAGTFNPYLSTCTAGTFCNIFGTGTNQAGEYIIFEESSQTSTCFEAYPDMTYDCLIADVGINVDATSTYFANAEYVPPEVSTSTATSTPVVDPNRDFAYGLYLFTAWFFGIYWVFSKKR